MTLPDGAAWYAAALKLNTTTDLTADQIHQIGLAEVKRIEGEQDALARSAGLKDRQAFYAEIVRRFPVVPWNDELRARYLKDANAALAFNRTLLPRYFGKLPVHAMEVVREPSFSEVAGGAAHAAGPSRDGARPGRVYVHLLGTTDATPPSALRDLMCHEGVPGHVMQGDIQVGQSGGPKFRQSARYVAFGEGWGLYAEALCKEMGAFPEASDDFMRLDAELFRAARLVVDTGIHAGGWTRERAQGFLRDNTALSTHEITTEVDRYIAWPGQALSYYMGELTFLAGRAKAEKALGARFDIRAFHDAMLSLGSVPLPMVDARVDRFIAEGGKGPYPLK